MIIKRITDPRGHGEKYELSVGEKTVSLFYIDIYKLIRNNNKADGVMADRIRK